MKTLYFLFVVGILHAIVKPAFALTWTLTTAPNLPWFSMASSADGKVLVAVPYGGPIYSSTNFGVTWTSNSAPTSPTWSGVCCSADGNKMVAVAYSGEIYASTNS